jgi:hypothetical protein
MNAEVIIEVVLEQFAKEVPAQFRETYTSMTGKLFSPLIDLVRDTVAQVEKGTKTAQAMWQTRAALATMAQRLVPLPAYLRNRDAGQKRAVASRKQKPQDIPEQLLAMIVTELGGERLLLAEPDRGTGFELRPTLTKLIRRVVDDEVARHPKSSDLAKLGSAVQDVLSKMAYLLTRASAALWQAAYREQPPSKTNDSLVDKRRPATAADSKAYFDALRQFMATIRRLNINPKTLPVGVEAIEEADALVAMTGFVTERYLELRRWTNPETCTDHFLSNHPQLSADYGNQVIDFYDRVAAGAAENPHPWSLPRDMDAEGTIADIINNLRHVANARRLDWDRSIGVADDHYEDELLNPWG